MNLNRFIVCLAQKIAKIYPSNCADEEDYIQAGYLKLAEINGNKYTKRNFQAYAIVAISRAMREAALEAMCAVSAPHRIKRLVHKIEIFLAIGKTEDEICQELNINQITFMSLKSLISTKSLHRLFDEPMLDSEPFCVLDDLLLSDNLTWDDKIFIQAQLNDTVENLGLTRKRRWLTAKNIRNKLVKSGYGI